MERQYLIKGLGNIWKRRCMDCMAHMQVVLHKVVIKRRPVNRGYDGIESLMHLNLTEPG